MISHPTYNYLVPADGTTHSVNFSGTVSANPYVISWPSFQQANFPFRPQGAKMVNNGTARLILTNQSTGETNVCPAGATRWVTFTSPANLIHEITGSGDVTIVFVDYPVIETAPVATDGTPIPASGDSVTVSNFPATQAVSGSVSVSNFPATQDVSVSNFPATQDVNATILQGGDALSVTNPAFVHVTNNNLVTAPTPATLVSGSASASGGTTIGTPPANSNIRLLYVGLSGDATQASGGQITATIALNSVTIAVISFYVAAAAQNVDYGGLERVRDFGHVAFNAGSTGTLTCSLSAALITGSVNVSGYFA